MITQPPATPAGLPYGIVMATGGTSPLAHACRLSTAFDLLLGLAVAQAIWILLLGVLRPRMRSAYCSGVVNDPRGVQT